MENNQPEIETYKTIKKTKKILIWLYSITGVAVLGIIVCLLFLGEKNENKNSTATEKKAIKKEKTGNLYGQINNHDWIDLGLPSGVKWATCNVGASSPQEYGDHYAWGETETKGEYSETNCSTHKKLFSELLDKGIVDDSGNLTKKYDIACLSWGEPWRMPTDLEYRELIELCDWEFISYKGVNGYQITGPNKSTIFLPAAGYRLGAELDCDGELGDYWSSSLIKEQSMVACSLGYSPKTYGRRCYGRYRGRSIRPVTD